MSIICCFIIEKWLTSISLNEIDKALGSVISLISICFPFASATLKLF